MDQKRTTNNLRGRNRKSVSLSQTIGPSSPVSCLWNAVSIWHFRLSWDNKTFSSTLCNISAWQREDLNIDCFPLPSVPWMWILTLFQNEQLWWAGIGFWAGWEKLLSRYSFLDRSAKPLPPKRGTWITIHKTSSATFWVPKDTFSWKVEMHVVRLHV